MAKKNLKGLISDTKPLDQPQDTYPHAKNGVLHFTKGVHTNEPGFLESPVVVPYTTIGIIETDEHPIFLSTDGTNSAIGFYNREDDTYDERINDASLSWKLGFSLEHYITGEYQKNSRGQYVIAFTDKRPFPRYINMDDTSSLNSVEDTMLFLQAEDPDISVVPETGGSLLRGSYNVAVKLAKADGSETGYLTISNSVVVTSSTGNQQTDQAIRINISHIDASYDFMIVAIIAKVNGVTSAVEMGMIPISGGEVSIVYTGNEFTTPIAIEEILVPPATYIRADTMGQLNDSLYIAGLSQEPDIDYQAYANDIKIQIRSRPHDLDSLPQEVIAGLERGFAHGEVYAFYIRLRFLGGAKSAAFHIPGRTSVAGELDDVTHGSVSGKRYQLEDTCLTPNLVNRTVIPGYWENMDEVYPTHPSFGPLQGLPVRHHRMPSQRYCKQNFYQTEEEYGTTVLDLLGIEALNVEIPPEISDRVTGYEILYARRTIGNSTTLGQSSVILGSKDRKIANPTNNFVSAGGNWNQVGLFWEKMTNWNDNNKKILNPVLDRVRMYPFEMLFNKPSLPNSDVYLFLQRKISVNNLRDYMVANGVNMQIDKGDRKRTNAAVAQAFVVTVTNAANTSISAVDPSDVIKGVDNIQYLPNNNSGVGEWNNDTLETAVGMRLDDPMPPHVIANNIYVAGGNNSCGSIFDPCNGTAQGSVSPAWMVNYEEFFIANIMVKRANVYNSFQSQPLISTGKVFRIGDPITPIWGGDSFIGLYTFHTYGWTGTDNDRGATDPDKAGIKVARQIGVESAANINARFPIPGNIHSQWWPNSSLPFNQVYSVYINSYIMQMSRSQDPNQFGYSSEFNALSEFETVFVYNPFAPKINDFPYRIARGGFFKREGLHKSWRTFLPLDYYEMQKNMGRFTNIHGMDDRLLIHMENALFVTQDKAKLESDIIQVTLGSGEIFEFEPQEALSSRLGYAGTQHDLACVQTPMGYIFVDAKQGQVFLYKGGLRLMNNGLNKFLKQYLRVEEKNVFIGNGITIGYDPHFNRVLLTVKDKQLSTDLGSFVYVPGYEETVLFFSSLIPNQSIVYRLGRYQLFLGTNTNPEYACPDIQGPQIGDYIFTINENSPVGFLVGHIEGNGGTGTLKYTILSGNTNGAFTLGITNGNITVANQSALDYETYPQFILEVRVTDDNGLTDTGQVTINLLNINEPPLVGNYERTVPETTPVGTEVVQVVGQDPEGLLLTYSFQTGHADWEIDGSTGIITSSNMLSFNTIPQYNLVVAVSDGVFTVYSNVVINVTQVLSDIVVENQVFQVQETQLPNTTFATMLRAQDPDSPGDDSDITYDIISSVPVNATQFDINTTQGSADFGNIQVVLGQTIAGGEVYTYTIRASRVSNTDQYKDYTVTIQVLPLDCPDTIEITFDVEADGPENATVTANVTGGTSPYTYLWSNGQTTQTITGVPRGSEYTVTVTDSLGCEGEASVIPNEAVLTGLTLRMAYFAIDPDDAVNDPYYPRLCTGSHGCNRARFEVFANGVSIGIANLNNAGGTSVEDGTIDDVNRPPDYPSYPSSDISDRYWALTLTGEQAGAIADPETGTVTFTLSYTGIDANPHSTASWFHISKDDNTMLLSTCVDSFTDFVFDPYDGV